MQKARRFKIIQPASELFIMKKITILLLLAVCAAYSLSAQTGNVNGHNQPDFPRHELGISYGVHPFMRNIDHDVAILIPGVWPYYPTSNFNINDEYFTLYGAINVFYQYNITPKHSAGVTLSGVLSKYTIPAGTMSGFSEAARLYGENEYSGHIGSLCLNVFYKFTYKTFDKCALYLGAGLGFNADIHDKTLYKYRQIKYGTRGRDIPDYTIYGNWARAFFYPSFQITALGIRIGQKNAANIELGFGSEGVFKAGYSCRF